jgi:surface antigen
VSAPPAGAQDRGDTRYPFKNDSRVCTPNGNTCHDDNNGFFIRECTSYAAWRLGDVNGYHLRGGIGKGAQDWGIVYSEITNPYPARGSIAWLRSGPDSGHVAWVSKVIGTDVLLEEYNWGKPEHEFNNKRRVPAKSFTGFIHFKDLPTTPNLLVTRAFSKSAPHMGDRFFNKTYKIVAGKSLKLSSSRDGTAKVQVDDVMAVTVTGVEHHKTLRHDFTVGGCAYLKPAGPFNLQPLLTKGVNTIRIQLSDKCGFSEGAPDLYLVGDFKTAPTPR